MTNGLRPYAEMRDSGVDWLGEVPTDWGVRRIKDLFREKDRRGGGNQGRLLSFTRERGIVPQADVSTRMPSASDLSKYKICFPGELIVNRMQAWSGMFAITPFEGLVSPDYCVFAARDVYNVCAKYFEYLFRTPMMIEQFAVRSKGIGTGFNRLYTPDFGAIRIPVPLANRQETIARFLDHADRCVRRYIHAKQKLTALLEEEKQTIIHKVITGQIEVRTGRPYARYKDSGKEQTGKVPHNWGARRLKSLCTMLSGEAITAESIERAGDFPVYGGNGLRGYTSDYTHEGEYALIGRQGALCGNVHGVRGRFWASEHAVVATLRKGYNFDWFLYSLVAMNLNQYSISAAQPGLSVERILNLWMPVPEWKEQIAIASAVNQAISKIDRVISRTKRETKMIVEFRTRLIADVVTGKLDVREAAATLPYADDTAEDADSGLQGTFSRSFEEPVAALVQSEA